MASAAIQPIQLTVSHLERSAHLVWHKAEIISDSLYYIITSCFYSRFQGFQSSPGRLFMGMIIRAEAYCNMAKTFVTHPFFRPQADRFSLTQSSLNYRQIDCDEDFNNPKVSPLCSLGIRVREPEYLISLKEFDERTAPEQACDWNQSRVHS